MAVVVNYTQKYHKLGTKQTNQYGFYGTFIHLCCMDVLEYLRNSKDVNLSEIARKMWPDNVDAVGRLSKKLKGSRSFTDKDAALARKVLHDLGIILTNLS